jgi:hypothetical protein
MIKKQGKNQALILLKKKITKKFMKNISNKLKI